MKRLIQETYDETKDIQWFETDPVMLGDGIIFEASNSGENELTKTTRQY